MQDLCQWVMNRNVYSESINTASNYPPQSLTLHAYNSKWFLFFSKYPAPLCSLGLQCQLSVNGTRIYLIVDLPTGICPYFLINFHIGFQCFIFIFHQ